MARDLSLRIAVVFASLINCRGALAVCIPSGGNIQAALTGPGAIAELCPNATFMVATTIAFTADNQEIRTQGLPTGSSRALLTISSPSVSIAIYGMNRSGIKIKNIRVNGNRPTYGYHNNGALLNLGGSATGQVVDHVDAYEPTGWSTIYVNEGPVGARCSGALITNNNVGPSGRSGANGTWADGIGLACTNSLVSGNTVTNATDGAIVIFGAPGSIVEFNTIRNTGPELLSGIALVDWGPFSGDFTGTKVRNNVIDASGGFIKVAIPMGQLVWACSNPPKINTGGSVTGNTLQGTTMGYGIVADGVTAWTATGNVDNSTNTGTPSVGCSGPNSSPTGFRKHAIHASGTFQAEFQEGVAEGAQNIVQTVTLGSITLSTGTAIAGTQLTGTATLTGPAPAGGAAVSLLSTNSSVAHLGQSSIVIPAGASAGSFDIYATVAGQTDIYGYYGGSKSAHLVVTNTFADPVE